MATVTMRTCDMCGNTKDVKTWTFGFDGRTYEIDLCPKDGNGLSKIKTDYKPKARKANSGQRRGSGTKPKTASSHEEAKASRARPMAAYDFVGTAKPES